MIILPTIPIMSPDNEPSLDIYQLYFHKYVDYVTCSPPRESPAANGVAGSISWTGVTKPP